MRDWCISRFRNPWRGGLVLLAFTCISAGQPVVNAGDDQVSMPLSSAVAGSIRLQGEASDASDSLRWSQLSGAAATIFNPVSANTPVSMQDTGAYTFVLRAYLGGKVAADTTRIMVRPNLPFKVLAPSGDAEVQIGKPFLVAWQIDPSTGCTAYYSVDDGLTYVMINTGSGVRDSIVWDVPSDLTPGTHGIIQVADYATKRLKTTGTFVLVDHPPIGIRSALSNRQARSSAHRSPFVATDHACVTGALDAGAFDAAGRTNSDLRRSGPAFRRLTPGRFFFDEVRSTELTQE